MRSALTTLVPFVAAAACIMFGGERLSQRETEDRRPADRDRLLDFAEVFRGEIERLETTYFAHLDRVATEFAADSKDARDEAKGVSAVDAAHVFTARFPATIKPRHREYLLTSVSQPPPKPPEVQIEGGETPFNADAAVVLPSELLYSKPAGSSGWLEAPGDAYRIRWSRPDALHLVALAIRRSELDDVLDRHLEEWIADPATPLREAGEHIAVRNQSGIFLASLGDENRGAAAMMLPFRTSLGEWQIQAWDRVRVTRHRDPATLAGAGTLAGFMVLAGIMLFIQQRRTMRLAEERVSFVNRVSHDLGTPLTNLALNADLAADAIENRPAESRRRLRIVTEEIERLGRLVANVLTFSRQERRSLTIDPQPCSADEEIDRVIESFRPALERRSIAIEHAGAADARVRLDPDALGQIIGNLVSNVEKYAASGKLLRIESQLQDDQLTIRVGDLGPGIPRSARQRIFRPFERIHRKVSEGSSGTGLGLAIAHDLAIRMGGSLHLLPTSPGSTFELRIPAPPAIIVLEDDNTSAA